MWLDSRGIGSSRTRLRGERGVEWMALSSLAAGSDVLFARTALALGLGWEVVLPLPPTEFRSDFDEKSWREVETLLAEARARARDH